MRKLVTYSHRHWPVFDEDAVDRQHRETAEATSPVYTPSVLCFPPPPPPPPPANSTTTTSLPPPSAPESGATRCLSQRGIVEFLQPTKPPMTDSDIQNFVGLAQLPDLRRYRKSIVCREFCERLWETLANTLVYLKSPPPAQLMFDLEIAEMDDPVAMVEDFVFLTLYLTSHHPKNNGSNSTLVLIRCGVAKLIHRALTLCGAANRYGGFEYPSLLLRMTVSLYCIVVRQKRTDLEPEIVKLMTDVYPNMKVFYSQVGEGVSSVHDPHGLHSMTLLALAVTGKDTALFSTAILSRRGAARLISDLTSDQSDGVHLYSALCTTTILCSTSYANASKLIACGLKPALFMLLQQSDVISRKMHRELQNGFWGYIWHLIYIVLSPYDLLHHPNNESIVSGGFKCIAEIVNNSDKYRSDKEVQRGLSMLLSVVQKGVAGCVPCGVEVARVENCAILLDILLKVDDFGAQVLVKCANTIEFIADHPPLIPQLLLGANEEKLTTAVILNNDEVILRLVAAIIRCTTGITLWKSLPLTELSARMPDYIEAQEYSSVDALSQILNAVYRSGEREVPFDKKILPYISKHSLHLLWLRQHVEGVEITSWWSGWLQFSTKIGALEAECELGFREIVFDSLRTGEVISSKWRKQAVAIRDLRLREFRSLNSRVLQNPVLPDVVVARQAKELSQFPSQYTEALKEVHITEAQWCTMNGHVHTDDLDLIKEMQERVTRLTLDVEHLVMNTSPLSSGIAAVNAAYFLVTKARRLRHKLNDFLTQIPSFTSDNERSIDGLILKRKQIFDEYTDIESEQGASDYEPCFLMAPEALKKMRSISPFNDYWPEYLSRKGVPAYSDTFCSYDLTVDVTPMVDLAMQDFAGIVNPHLLSITEGSSDPMQFAGLFLLRSMYSEVLHTACATPETSLITVNKGFPIERFEFDGTIKSFEHDQRVVSLHYANVMLNVLVVFDNGYCILQKDQLERMEAKRRERRRESGRAELQTETFRAEEAARLDVITEYSTALRGLLKECPEAAEVALREHTYFASTTTLHQRIVRTLNAPPNDTKLQNDTNSSRSRTSTVTTTGVPTPECVNEEHARHEIIREFCEELGDAMPSQQSFNADLVDLELISFYASKVRGGASRTQHFLEDVSELCAHELQSRLEVLEAATHEWCIHVVAAYCGMVEWGCASPLYSGDVASIGFPPQTPLDTATTATRFTTASSSALSWDTLPGLDDVQGSFDFSKGARSLLHLDSATEGYEHRMLEVAIEERSLRWRCMQEEAHQHRFVLGVWGVAELYKFQISELTTQHVAQRKDIIDSEANLFKLLLKYAEHSTLQTLHLVTLEGMKTRERGAILALKKKQAKERSDLNFTQEVELRRKKDDTQVGAKQAMQRSFAEIKWDKQVMVLAERHHKEREAFTVDQAGRLATFAAETSKLELLSTQKSCHIDTLHVASAEHSHSRVCDFIRAKTELAYCSSKALTLWSTLNPDDQSSAMLSLARTTTLCTLKSVSLKELHDFELRRLNSGCQYERACLTSQLTEASSCAAYIAVSSDREVHTPPTPMHIVCQELESGVQEDARKLVAKETLFSVFNEVAERWERAVWAVHIPFYPLQLPGVGLKEGTEPTNTAHFLTNSPSFIKPTNWTEWQTLLQEVYTDEDGKSLLDASAIRSDEPLCEAITEEHLQAGNNWVSTYQEDIAARKVLVSEMEADIVLKGVYIVGRDQVAAMDKVKKNVQEEGRYFGTLWRYYRETTKSASEVTQDCIFFTFLRQRLEKVVALGVETYQNEVAKGPLTAAVEPTTQDEKGNDATSELLHASQANTTQWIISFESAVSLLFETDMRAILLAKRCTYYIKKLRVIRSALEEYSRRFAKCPAESHADGSNTAATTSLKENLQAHFALLQSETEAEYTANDARLRATRAHRLEANIQKMREVATAHLKMEVKSALNNYIKAEWVQATENAISSKRKKNKVISTLVKEQLRRTTAKAFTRQSYQEQAVELQHMRTALSDLLQKNQLGALQFPPLPTFVHVLRFIPLRSYHYAEEEENAYQEEAAAITADCVATSRVLYLMSFLPKQPARIDAVLGTSLGKWGSIQLDHKTLLQLVKKAENKSYKVEFDAFVGEMVLRHNVRFEPWSPIDRKVLEMSEHIKKRLGAGHNKMEKVVRPRDEAMEKILKISDVSVRIEEMGQTQRALTLQFMDTVRSFHISQISKTQNVTGSIDEFETELLYWVKLIQSSLRWSIYCVNDFPCTPSLWNLPSDASQLTNKILLSLITYFCMVSLKLTTIQDKEEHAAMADDLQKIITGRIMMLKYSNEHISKPKMALETAQCLQRLAFEQKVHSELSSIHGAWSVLSSKQGNALSIEANKEFFKQTYALFIDYEGERDELLTRHKSERTVALFGDFRQSSGTEATPTHEPDRSILETISEVFFVEILSRTDIETAESSGRNEVLQCWETDCVERRRTLFYEQYSVRKDILVEESRATASVLAGHIHNIVLSGELQGRILAKLSLFESAAADFHATSLRIDTENLMNEEAGELGWRQEYDQTVLHPGADTGEEERFLKKWVRSRSTRVALTADNSKPTHSKTPHEECLQELLLMISPAYLKGEFFLSFLLWKEQEERCAIEVDLLTVYESAERSTHEESLDESHRVLMKGWSYCIAELRQLEEEMARMESGSGGGTSSSTHITVGNSFEDSFCAEMKYWLLARHRWVKEYTEDWMKDEEEEGIDVATPSIFCKGDDLSRAANLAESYNIVSTAVLSEASRYSALLSRVRAEADTVRNLIEAEGPSTEAAIALLVVSYAGLVFPEKQKTLGRYGFIKEVLGERARIELECHREMVFLCSRNVGYIVAHRQRAVMVESFDALSYNERDSVCRAFAAERLVAEGGVQRSGSFVKQASFQFLLQTPGLCEMNILFNPTHVAQHRTEDDDHDVCGIFFPFLEQLQHQALELLRYEQPPINLEALKNTITPSFDFTFNSTTDISVAPSGHLSERHSSIRDEICAEETDAFLSVVTLFAKELFTNEFYAELREAYTKWDSLREDQAKESQLFKDIVKTADISLKESTNSQRREMEAEFFALYDANKDKGDLTCIQEYHIIETEEAHHITTSTSRDLEDFKISLRNAFTSRHILVDSQKDAIRRTAPLLRTKYVHKIAAFCKRFDPNASAAVSWLEKIDQNLAFLDSVYSSENDHILYDEMNGRSTIIRAWREQHIAMTHSVPGAWLQNALGSRELHRTAAIETLRSRFALETYTLLGQSLFDKSPAVDVATVLKRASSAEEAQREAGEVDFFTNARSWDRTVKRETRCLAYSSTTVDLPHNIKASEGSAEDPHQSHIWVTRETFAWSAVFYGSTPPLLARQTLPYEVNLQEACDDASKHAEEELERHCVVITEAVERRVLEGSHLTLQQCCRRHRVCSEERSFREELQYEAAMKAGVQRVLLQLRREVDEGHHSAFFGMKDVGLTHQMCQYEALSVFGSIVTQTHTNQQYYIPLNEVQATRNSVDSLDILHQKICTVKSNANTLLTLLAVQRDSFMTLLLEEYKERAAIVPIAEGEDFALCANFLNVFLSAIEVNTANPQNGYNREAVLSPTTLAIEESAELATAVLAAGDALRVVAPQNLFVLDLQSSEGAVRWKALQEIEVGEAFARNLISTSQMNFTEAWACRARWAEKACGFYTELCATKGMVASIVQTIHWQRWRMTVGVLLRKKEGRMNTELRSVDEYVRSRVVWMKDVFFDLRALEVQSEMVHSAATQLCEKDPVCPEQHEVLAPLPKRSSKITSLYSEELLARHVTDVTETATREKLELLCSLNHEGVVMTDAHTTHFAKLWKWYSTSIPRLFLIGRTLRLRSERPVFVIKQTLAETTDLVLMKEQRTKQGAIIASEAKGFTSIRRSELKQRHISECTKRKTEMFCVSEGILRSIFSLRGWFLETQLITLMDGVEREALFTLYAVLSTELSAWDALQAAFVEDLKTALDVKKANVVQTFTSLRYALTMKESKERNELLNILKQWLAAADTSGDVYLTIAPPTNTQCYELVRVGVQSGIAELRVHLQGRYPTVASLPIGLFAHGQSLPSYHKCAKYASCVIHVMVQPHRKRTPLASLDAFTSDKPLGLLPPLEAAAMPRRAA